MFNFSLAYLPNERVIKVHTFGTFGSAANEELVVAAVKASKQHGATLFLVDHRQADIALGILYISDIPKVNGQLGIKPDFQVALVCREDPREYEKFEYFENLSYLEGYNRRVFTDDQPALKWLLESQKELALAD
jgi:hypothetical protein